MPYIGPVRTAQYVLAYHHARWDATTMVAIAGAESGWNTTAISPTDDYGLFQVNLRAWPQLFASGNYMDPAVNTSWAFHIFNVQGITAWSTYTNGAYNQYMRQAADAVNSAGGSAAPPPSGGGIDTVPAGDAYDPSDVMRRTADRIGGAGYNLNYWAKAISEI